MMRIHFRLPFTITRANDRKQPPAPVPAPDCVPEVTCAYVTEEKRLYSPLIAETMGAYTHTKHLAGLAQDERCVNEYQLAARTLIQHIFEGWQNLTDGRGTIDELLMGPRRGLIDATPVEQFTGRSGDRDRVGRAAG